MKLSRYPLLLVVITSWLLVACGGGGSSSPPPPPAVPNGVTAVAKDGYVLVDATLASDATGANVYYGTTAGVTTSTGTKVIVGSSPQAITGLTNTQTYYFLVTALNAGGESAATTAVSAVPQTTSLAGTGDPLYGDQWHLKNTGQSGVGSTGTMNEDLNVEPVWQLSTPIKGAGVRVAVVDDGLEIGHEDLASNMAANNQSYNYVTGSNDPTNSVSDTTSGHGTAVAGIIAARDDNGLGVKGVAPRASLVGYNLLQSSISTNEADAMSRNAAVVSISSNSWGAADGTGELDASTSLWRTAINTGLTTGRGGKGTVYMWAAGNGAGINGSAACPNWQCIDNSNYDGRANYRGVMAVAAVNDQGKRSSYSESGSNLWVSAPGGEFCSTHTISTTDRTGSPGINSSTTAGTTDYADQRYTKCMNGTSAATPSAAGVVALMLAANPSLGWRDVRIILAQTARKNDVGDAGWALTGGTPQYHFNHKYGFGVADAAAAVSAAQAYTTNVGTELTYTTALSTLSPTANSIPDYDPVTGSGAGRSDSITVTGSGISSIEYVEVTFTATNSPYSGDLGVTLTSPNGATVSVLAVPHLCAGTYGACTSTYNGWVFGSSRHLGEAADGIWMLTVKDGYQYGTGNFTSWKLKFYGH
jgi:kexin